MSVSVGRLSQYRCTDCGYGASRKAAPDRCPMCGGKHWLEAGKRAVEDIASDLAAAARRAAIRAGADEDAPLVRELKELSVFPGVPLS